jgi:hypothetical protein
VSCVVVRVALTRCCGHVLLWRNLITVFFAVNTLLRMAKRTWPMASPPRPPHCTDTVPQASAAPAAPRRSICTKALVLGTLRATRGWRLGSVPMHPAHTRADAPARPGACTSRAHGHCGTDAHGGAMTELRESARTKAACPPRRNERRRACPASSKRLPRVARRVCRVSLRLRPAWRRRRDRAGH